MARVPVWDVSSSTPNLLRPEPTRPYRVTPVHDRRQLPATGVSLPGDSILAPRTGSVGTIIGYNTDMVPVLIDSIDRPLSDLPQAQALAIALLVRPQTMGLLPPETPEHVDLDWDFLRAVAEVLEENGVAAAPSSLLDGSSLRPSTTLKLQRRYGR